MQSYVHLTTEDRQFLHEKLNLGWSIRKIADAMDRSPSTISREIQRNKSKRPKKPSANVYNYHFWRATILTKQRRQEHRCHAIVLGTPLCNFILDKLGIFWSPEQIAAKWRELHPESHICFATIYRYVKEKRLPKVTAQANLRRRGKAYRHGLVKTQSIHPDRLIIDWSEEIKNRTEIGHWEGDTIYGGVGKGCCITLVDRKARKTLIAKCLSRNSREIRLQIERMLQGYPVKSISFDNGSEFAEFRELERNLNTLIYFAEPHKPWQRGTNENTNDIIRFFFPKGCDFREIPDETIQRVSDLLNNRPRKCLGWKTPNEVFFSVAIA